MAVSDQGCRLSPYATGATDGLYWLQDRDSMPNWYTINHPTTLHTHNETQ